MIRSHTLITATLAALAIAGCASTTTSTTAAGAPSSAPSAAPSAEPSSGPCTTRACIAADAQGMTGTVAKDNSVLTKMKCRKATVRQPTPGVYTVHCTATYSDGSVWTGIASVLTSQGRVAWQATGEISGG